MVEHSIPARYTSFHDDMAAFFFIENFPKLRACNPNFRQTYRSVIIDRSCVSAV